MFRLSSTQFFRKTWHFDGVFNAFFFFFSFWLISNLLKSSSTQFVVVLSFIAFCTAPFSSKHFSVLSNFQGRFHILIFFIFWGGGGLFLSLSLFSDCVDFSYSESSFFLLFSSIFYASSTEHFFLLVLFFLAGLHCLLRIHALNSCVGDTWRRLWRDDFTQNGKQVVNRLKIPQGLSTLMFRRWSEVPSRGGVRGGSP